MKVDVGNYLSLLLTFLDILVDLHASSVGKRNGADLIQENEVQMLNWKQIRLASVGSGLGAEGYFEHLTIFSTVKMVPVT